ncbi:helix-turn-helix domain-containing protein [Acinetobacter bereziniae]|uniref:helix-turn-helix domain-containing protein n=1 Tax=Acinetobacter bereziniae TaxID=106648 RepID=UPI0019000C21|nr:helix-turn-helix domain-containing protein [Acinetobacter bereziniae]MBJ8424553.1 helix-turn-helix domain-containing protein [Acinetobacter bereziniae]QQC79467.1 helix-turn-helix domain-containing protein [Acinetobacter bereziniae]UUN92544.1 helix-turn-helix domain containing protein [Acinetobacter bereziniae]
MNVDDLMTHYKCKSKKMLSAEIGISRVTLWKWSKQGIPYDTQAVLQLETKGALMADQDSKSKN